MVTDTSKKKVLVVEDEKPLAHALELKLTPEGFAVTVPLNVPGRRTVCFCEFASS